MMGEQEETVFKVHGLWYACMLWYQALFKQTKDINIDFAFAWMIS